MLGYVALPAGEYENVVVELDEPLAENAMVWAVLHAMTARLASLNSRMLTSPSITTVRPSWRPLTSLSPRWLKKKRWPKRPKLPKKHEGAEEDAEDRCHGRRDRYCHLIPWVVPDAGVTAPVEATLSRGSRG